MVKITWSPGPSVSMLRNGRLWVTRWPATTTFPVWLGSAVPGQCPTPVLLSVVSVTPSNSEGVRPSLGMATVPIRFSGSGACALAGARAGVGSGCAVVGGAAVVGGKVLGGSVVAAVVGAAVVGAAVVAALEGGASVVAASASPGSS